jgi:hypothetical protein
MYTTEYFTDVSATAIPVRLTARSFILPIPAGIGQLMVYPFDVPGQPDKAAGKPILSKNGEPKGTGIVFQNYTDGAVQAVRDDGKSIIIFNGISREQGLQLLNFYSELAGANLLAITAPQINEILDFAHDTLGINDFFNGDLSKVSGFESEVHHRADSNCGVFLRRSSEERFALLGIGSGTYAGPASTPQKFSGDVVLVRNEKHAWLVQTSVFQNTYRHPNNQEISLTDLPAFAMSEKKAPERLKSRAELLASFHISTDTFPARETASGMQVIGWRTLFDAGFSTLEEVFYTTKDNPNVTSRTFQTKKDLGAVTVLLYDPVADKIVMISEARIMGLLFGDSGLMPEAPTGGIKKSKINIAEDQRPDDAARAEVLEETRCTTSNLICLKRGRLESAGRMDARDNLYIARVDIHEIQADLTELRGNLAEGEYIRAHIITPEQLAELWMETDARLNAGTDSIAGTFIWHYQAIRSHFLSNPPAPIVETLADVLGPSRWSPAALLGRATLNHHSP